MGAKAEILDDGCCGMAGSFGFESPKYDISMKVYEHELGPRLRSQPAERIVLADGFSCKTQIEQATGKRPLHLAQLLANGGNRDGGTLQFVDEGAPVSDLMKVGAMLAGGFALGIGAIQIGRRLFR